MLLNEGIFVPEDNDQLVLDFVTSDSFPLYYQPGVLDTHFYGHILMIRSEIEKREGRVNSPHYVKFKNLFLKICKQNDVKPSLIYRMAINSNFTHPDPFSGVHEDHGFEHTNFIMYLSEFTNGETYLFDYQYQITDIIKPELNKYAFFKGPHAAGTCLPGERRLVFVTTFRETK